MNEQDPRFYFERKPERFTDGEEAYGGGESWGDEEIDKSINSLGTYIDNMYKKTSFIPEYPT